jgi:hypothetical protein
MLPSINLECNLAWVRSRHGPRWLFHRGFHPPAYGRHPGPYPPASEPPLLREFQTFLIRNDLITLTYVKIESFHTARTKPNRNCSFSELDLFESGALSDLYEEVVDRRRQPA